MKKMIIALVAGWIPALASITGAQAQTSTPYVAKATPAYSFELNKANDALNGEIKDITAINNRAIKNFKREYKGVQNASWYRVGKSFIVKFQENGISNTVYYLLNGTWAGSLKGYKQDKLPKAIRQIVNSTYADFDIFYINEAETPESNGTPTYIVYLEGRKSYKWLRICNDEMEIWKEVQKQQ